MDFGDVDDNSSFGGGPRPGPGLGELFDADGPAPFSGDNSSFNFEQPIKAVAPAPVATVAEGPASDAPTVLFATQGQLTTYDSANQPMDKGVVG